jgi:hypothetical protein
VEKPWTIPAQTSAFIGFIPRKFIAIGTAVNATMSA